MNISFEMRAARQIMVEQRYLSVRGMVYRRSRGKPAGLDPRSLKRYVRINYVVSWISFSIISLILFYFRSSGAIDLQEIVRTEWITYRKLIQENRKNSAYRF